MQPIGTVCKSLVEDYPGIIPIEFGQNPISGLGEEVVRSSSYIIQCKIVTPGQGHLISQGPNLNDFERGPLNT